MPICALCDIALNAHVLSFMNIPDRLDLMVAYSKRVTREQGR